MKFRPCIDLHKGTVKQIVGSTYTDNDSHGLVTNFESTAPSSYYASLYKKDNLTGGHLILIGPGNRDAAFDALGAFPNGLHVGGGITPENAQEFLDAGASHVIMTSYIFSHGKIQWDRLAEAKKKIGKANIVLDLSCVKSSEEYKIVTDRWQNISDETVDERMLRSLGAYCDEFLVHAASVEGKKSGIDFHLVALLGEKSPIPVTYAGGISTLDDIEMVYKAGKGLVDFTIGSALDIFGGSLAYRDVVNCTMLYT